MNQTPHTQQAFDADLESFLTDIRTMSQQTLTNLENATQGLLTEDKRLCNITIVEDEEIDALEMEIDQKGMHLLLRYQPFASDLRSILSGMKVTNNLERISDHARAIAKRARKLSASLGEEEKGKIQEMSQRCIDQLRNALRAYENQDVTLAVETKQSDKQLDKLYKRTLNFLTQELPNTPQNQKRSQPLDLIFICRAIERIGDRAKNIAEEAVFAETAEDIRHGGEIA